MVAAAEHIIRGQARKFSRSGLSDVEELTQLGRVAVLAAIETFDPEGRALWTTYAYLAARNAIANEVRTLRRTSASLDAPLYDGEEGETVLDGLPSPTVTPDVALESAERSELVRTILARVRAESRNPDLFDRILQRLQLAVAVSARYEGVTQRSEITLDEIARACDCTRENVRLHEKRIKATLAVALSEVA
jgi:RNA polymerase sigma factor (sigma-70 family)